MHIVTAMRYDKKNRKTAREKGESKYIKNVHCHKCGGTVFYVVNNTCVECTIANSREYQKRVKGLAT